VDVLVARHEGADLGFAHLEGGDLRLAHLEGADLSGADLRGVEFRRASVWAVTAGNSAVGLSDMRDIDLQIPDLPALLAALPATTPELVRRQLIARLALPPLPSVQTPFQGAKAAVASVLISDPCSGDNFAGLSCDMTEPTFRPIAGRWPRSGSRPSRLLEAPRRSKSRAGCSIRVCGRISEATIPSAPKWLAA
jgi:Pentapeptide repeats (8 copies)